jgi:alkylhydroperoxidase family enzyme
MSRIAPGQPPFPPTLEAYLKRAARQGVPPLVLFTTLGRSERTWTRFSGGSLLDRSSPLTLRDRELVINRTSARTGCEYEWGVHVWLFAERAGLTRDEVAATLSEPLDASAWCEKEAALLNAVDALHDRSTLSDREFEDLSRHYREDQVLEILQLAAFYHQVAYFANGLALPLEPSAARFADYRPAPAPS